MAAAILESAMPYDWSTQRDEEGHREYELKWKVITSSPLDGPDIAMAAAGLPLPGVSLSVGYLVNPYAFYYAKGSARLWNRAESMCIWDISTPYTTKPCRRCMTNQMGNPLLEPWQAKGGFNKLLKEAMKCYVDEDGTLVEKPILNSAGQRFRGAAVQMDVNHPTFVIAGNVAWIDLDVIGDVVNSTNKTAWWGQAARTIKCTDFSWEMVLWGTCNYYFKVVCAFEINKETWDLKPLDEGDMLYDKTVNGKKQFKRATDNYEHAIHCLLDGYGNKGDAADPVFCDGSLKNGTDAVPGPFRVRKEMDFSTVGWPSNVPGISM